MARRTDFHLALAVNNIKNFIPVTLEMEKGQYSSWAELFKIHCRAYMVINHIIKQQPSEKEKKITTEVDHELLSLLDAVFNGFMALSKTIFCTPSWSRTQL